VMAKRTVPQPIFEYVDGAAWDEVTARRNRTGFERFELLPRMLVDAANVEMSTTALGREIALPIIGAPTGMTGLNHPDGEGAIARAAHSVGTIYTQSALSSLSVEEVSAVAAGPKWFQLYVMNDRGVARDMLARASAAGYEALVLTVDVQVAGVRERDVRNRFSVPPRLTLRAAAQGVVRPRWSRNFITRPRLTTGNMASPRQAAGEEIRRDVPRFPDDLLEDRAPVVGGRLRVGDERVAAAPILLGRSELYDERQGGPFFRQMDFRFLVLERDNRTKLANPPTVPNLKRIYRIDLSKNGLQDVTDVSNVPSLPEKGTDLAALNITPVPKVLFVDLLNDVYKVDATLTIKDVIAEKPEALAWGPDLPDGRHVLYLLSDNDLNPNLATQIYAFAVDGALAGITYVPQQLPAPMFPPGQVKQALK